MKQLTPTTCPVAFSLDIFGDKWTLIILRDILLGGKSHFREFLASPEKIASNILSARLEGMVKDGMLAKEVDPKNKSAVIYKPTKKTLDLLPMLLELMRWANNYNETPDSRPEVLEMLGDLKSSRQLIENRFI